MKIKMLRKVSGTRNGEDWPEVGQVWDMPTPEAQDQIAIGNAIEATGDDAKGEVRKAVIANPAVIEAASVTAPESAKVK